MGENLTLFKSEEFGEIRTLYIDGEVWFVGKDVCKCLEVGNPSQAISRLDEEEKNTIILNEGIGNPEKTIINESGLYSLVLSSRKPEAKKFKKWVTSEVLPAIRKTYQALENIEFKGNIDGLVWSRNGVAVTSSRVIANYTGKEHGNILRDIREELEKLKNIASNLKTSPNLENINPNMDTSPNFDLTPIINDFKENIYLDTYGREQVEYELGEMASMQLLLKYSTEHRARFILMFNKMKEALYNMFKAKVIESVLPQDNRLRQYIYILKNPLNETIKIGVAQDVEKRIKQLQTGAGIELELIYQSLICSNAFSIEKEVHSKFEEFRTFGEWFKINPNNVIDFLEQQRFVLKSEFLKSINILNLKKKD